MAYKKNIRFGSELHFIAVLYIILAIVLLIGNNLLFYPQVIMGLLFSLFLPGYIVTVAVFPKKYDLGTVERVVLSCGLSTVLIMLLGMGLNYTPWGVKPIPVISLMAVYIAVMSGLALYRRRQLPLIERFIPVLEVKLPELRKVSFLEKVFSGLLLLVLFGAVAGTLLIAVVPKAGESFTDFYILGENGKADGYPQSLTVGEKERVIVGIVNNENEKVTYRVQVNIGGYIKSTIGPFTLDHQEKWEKYVELSVQESHEKVKVDFLLFRECYSNPDQPLHPEWLQRLGERMLIFRKEDQQLNKEEEELYRSLYLWIKCVSKS